MAFCFIKSLQLHLIHVTVYISLQTFTVVNDPYIWHKIILTLSTIVEYYHDACLGSPGDEENTAGPQIHLELKSHPNRPDYGDTSHRKIVYSALTKMNKLYLR